MRKEKKVLSAETPRSCRISFRRCKYSPRIFADPDVPESSYQGTRSAEELAGGDTFFQDTWVNGVSVKAVHSLSEQWTVRERVGYRSKWFRETTDGDLEPRPV